MCGEGSLSGFFLLKNARERPFYFFLQNLIKHTEKIGLLAVNFLIFFKIALFFDYDLAFKNFRILIFEVGVLNL